MLLERLEVSNYRSLRSIDIDFGLVKSENDRALLALLGRNGAGKSSVLYALEAFYDVGAKLTSDDCFGHEMGPDIVIRVTYGALREEERAEFAPYIDNDKLIVTKRIQVTDTGCISKYFAAARQVPQFAALRRLGKRDRLTAFKDLVASGQLQDLVGAPKSADQADELMDSYEAEHPELLETVEREEQFFGPKQVGGGKLDKFTKFVLVPAVRNAATEEQRKGAIYELINMIVLRQVNRRPDVRRLREEMNEKIRQIYSEENLTELRELGDSISALLEQYAPGAALRLAWGEATIPDLALPQAVVDLVEDDYPCPISYSGHGLQRSLVLTLLQYLATISLSEEPDEIGDQDDSAARDSGEATAATVVQVTDEEESETRKVLDPDLVLAIEEPELFLHPSRCRHLSELFLSLSRLPADPKVPRNQIVYVTHSPYFVDLHRFDQVRIAHKTRPEGAPAPLCTISQYSLDEAASALAVVAGRRAEEFTRDSFRARSLPVMTIAVNEGFFANGVVVVEGLSDVGALWTVQRLLGMQWAARGITIVPALGKENLDRPVVVFRGLRIPTYFIFDADGDHKGNPKKETQSLTRNQRYQRLAGLEPVPFPATQVHDQCAVFERDLEAELRAATGAEFDALSQTAADELRYDATRDLLKNTEGAARLVELIYAAGHQVPVLEEIANRVTALCLRQEA